MSRTGGRDSTSVFRHDHGSRHGRPEDGTEAQEPQDPLGGVRGEGGGDRGSGRASRSIEEVVERFRAVAARLSYPDETAMGWGVRPHLLRRPVHGRGRPRPGVGDPSGARDAPERAHRQRELRGVAPGRHHPRYERAGPGPEREQGADRRASEPGAARHRLQRRRKEPLSRHGPGRFPVALRRERPARGGDHRHGSAAPSYASEPEARAPVLPADSSGRLNGADTRGAPAHVAKASVSRLASRNGRQGAAPGAARFTGSEASADTNVMPGYESIPLSGNVTSHYISRSSGGRRVLT